jgi:hypothetical protein
MTLFGHFKSFLERIRNAFVPPSSIIDAKEYREQIRAAIRADPEFQKQLIRDTESMRRLAYQQAKIKAQQEIYPQHSQPSTDPLPVLPPGKFRDRVVEYRQQTGHYPPPEDYTTMRIVPAGETQSAMPTVHSQQPPPQQWITSYPPPPPVVRQPIERPNWVDHLQALYVQRLATQPLNGQVRKQAEQAMLNHGSVEQQ